MLCKFEHMSLSGYFQIIVPIMLQWMMPQFFLFCFIRHVLARFVLGGGRGGSVIGVLDFGPRENIHLLLCVTLVLIYGMHLNICVESLLLFYILLLSLDMTRCNLIIV